MSFLVSQNGEFAVRTELIKELYIGNIVMSPQKHHLSVVIEGEDDDVVVGRFTSLVTARNNLKDAVRNVTGGYGYTVGRDTEKAEVSE